MKYRQEFQCWQCGERYSLPLPKEDIATWIVTCPYCGSEAAIDLKAFPREKTLYRADGQDASPLPAYALPDLIVTRKPD